MAVCSGGQISALTLVHVGVTKHNVLWLVWDSSLVLSGVHGSQGWTVSSTDADQTEEMLQSLFLP